ncbi:hypothetical protein EV356DRAFT_23860 [Viridothelium virens]|uniref:Uncharacterized protein n=1 Tax=Viridothelium virens TaxID=1048519 RepID=A0A6A6GTF0_VIRVR|nr:hypothetical protein EV356DRAFT_23860 [Viridothelium virens]
MSLTSHQKRRLGRLPRLPWPLLDRFKRRGEFLMRHGREAFDASLGLRMLRLAQSSNPKPVSGRTRSARSGWVSPRKKSRASPAGTALEHVSPAGRLASTETAELGQFLPLDPSNRTATDFGGTYHGSLPIVSLVCGQDTNPESSLGAHQGSEAQSVNPGNIYPGEEGMLLTAQQWLRRFLLQFPHSIHLFGRGLPLGTVIEHVYTQILSFLEPHILSLQRTLLTLFSLSR